MIPTVGEMSTHLSSHPTSAAAARRFVREVLRTWGCAREAVETILLGADELVTNAILHVGSDIDLVLRQLGNRLRVEVRDGSPRPPLRRVPAPDAECGRGLHLVDRLSDRWGVTHLDGGGKTVWFEVSLEEATP